MSYLLERVPMKNEMCSDCDHEFRWHYITFDGIIMGCAKWSELHGDPVTPPAPCHCRGFAIRYTYRPSPDANTVQNH